MSSNSLSRLGKYISTKPNFLKASVLGLGTPTGLVGAFLLDDYGRAMPFFGFILALIASYFWGQIMWAFMFRDIYARQSSKLTTSAPPPTSVDDDQP
jgi:hypothetical protein